jgi:glutathione peroxidase
VEGFVMQIRPILMIIGFAAAGWGGTAASAVEPPAGPGGGDPAIPASTAGAPAQQEEASQVDKTLFDFTMTTIDGQERPLREYEGKVVMVVNVASKCGLTPQYEALERLYEEKKDEGFVILAFPANNFGGQEPGTNEEIKTFCTERYEVTFPLFAKISVKGEDQHELYRWLTSQPKPQEGGQAAEPGAVGGEIAWNFTKFLIGPDGKPVARFEPRTTPDDPALVAKVEELLAALPSAEGERKETAAP